MVHTDKWSLQTNGTYRQFKSQLHLGIVHSATQTPQRAANLASHLSSHALGFWACLGHNPFSIALCSMQGRFTASVVLSRRQFENNEWKEA